MIHEYRFWHFKHKEMFPVDQLQWIDGEIAFVCADHMHEAWCFKIEEGILMQWTGEFDSNGIKIFQDDIVLVDSENISGHPPANALVEWWQLTEITLPGWNLWYMGESFPTKCGKGMHSGTGLGPFDLAQYTLVGNKHQNPELIINMKGAV